MVSLENETALLRRFEGDWRSIGWWAETSFRETSQTFEFRVALFSPRRLREMIDEEHRDDTECWRNTSSFLRPTLPPQRSEIPSPFYMDDMNWSVGGTAILACGGAIVIAKRLYPLEMPTAKQFRHAIEMSKPI